MRKSTRKRHISSSESLDITNANNLVKNNTITDQQEKENKPNKKMKRSARKFIGAHTSIKGGLHCAVEEASRIGATAFSLFLKSQRQWKSKPLTEDAAAIFKSKCNELGFAPGTIIPHGSYLMNCGSPKAELLSKSRDMLIDELTRCQMLGINLFNFHPGSTCGEISVSECIKKISESINIALSKTKNVTAVIENMSRQGNTIGGHFTELRDIIKGVKDKSRIGVCLDTCHTYAAGYDITSDQSYNQTIEEFDKIVGLKYLRAFHLNDSKMGLGSHRDLHENIGKGKLGLHTFKRILEDPRLDGLPFIIETPLDMTDEEEVKILFTLLPQ